MELKKVLTLRTVIATSAGLTLSSSTFVAAVQVAGFLAGESAWLAILTGGLLCITAAFCFNELNGMMPSAAGIRLYFSRAFNDRLALIISLLYMAVILGVIGAESYVLSEILHQAFPVLPSIFWIIAMFTLVTIMNIVGIKIAGWFQDAITYGLIISLAALAIVALNQVNFHINAPFSTGGGLNFINAVAVGVFLFVGFEWVTPLAEEVTHSRLISRGMLLAIGILSVTYALFTVAMTATVPKDILVNSAIPQMIFARTLLGGSGAAIMVLITLAASITTFNAGLISISRFVYASARENVLPTIFSKISMRYFTPWVAIVCVFIIGVIISSIVLITERYLTLVNMAAAMESIIYVLAGVAVIVLRKKLPDMKRPYQIPGGYWIPGICAGVFSLLTLAIFFSFPGVFIYLCIGVVLSVIYVNQVVPELKRRNRVKKSANRRRRPAVQAEKTGD
ncbi:Amino acid transporter [Desulfotomaculum arcticum]|uniref:Amino acid transporter n=1 Tax=Desulfotruncus arcticus DSM 17038 TaxID=1121424 RepID=A0A1I2N691_9FIRM|nr:APC family permease [Desulfotruncus arcticus]SFF99292.1 Amino acid transporter [Desulfotomaculum arcticum] [Desulfotruncus arcticus DSM 17038]